MRKKHDLQHAAAQPHRQPDPVAMDRVRAGQGAHRHRQGRDRPGHPHRHDADRGGGARRAAGPDPPGVRRDRRQPVGIFHLGQLFGFGRRRRDPAGVRRGARHVDRQGRRGAGLQAERAVRRGRAVPARRQGDRSRLLVDGAVHQPGPAGERHRADQEPVQIQDRRHQPAAARPAGQGQGRRLHPRHRGRRRGPCPDAAPAVEGRAARFARRGGGAQGGRGADRNYP